MRPPLSWRQPTGWCGSSVATSAARPARRLIRQCGRSQTACRRRLFRDRLPRFLRPADKLGHTFYSLGSNAGPLRVDLAHKWGLPEGVAVAVGNVDSFVSFRAPVPKAAALTSWSSGPPSATWWSTRQTWAWRGLPAWPRTASCPAFSVTRRANRPLVTCSVVRGKPGRSGRLRFGGQHPPPAGAGGGGAGPAQTGLVALDWWNGNRSVLADADLSGVIAGSPCRPARPTSTGPCSSRSLRNKGDHGQFQLGRLDLKEIVACGGIAEKTRFSCS